MTLSHNSALFTTMHESGRGLSSGRNSYLVEMQIYERTENTNKFDKRLNIWVTVKQVKHQTLAGSSFLNVRIYCFSLSFMIVNREWNVGWTKDAIGHLFAVFPTRMLYLGSPPMLIWQLFFFFFYQSKRTTPSAINWLVDNLLCLFPSCPLSITHAL